VLNTVVHNTECSYASSCVPRSRDIGCVDWLSIPEPEVVLLLSSAIVWFGFGVDLSVSVGEVDFVVRVRRREPEVGLVFDFVLVEVLDEGLDRLLLGEDAMGEDWESCLVPPSTFFWTTEVFCDEVDGDCEGFSFELFVTVVPVLEATLPFFKAFFLVPDSSKHASIKSIKV